MASQSLEGANLLGKLRYCFLYSIRCTVLTKNGIRCAWGADHMPTTCATYPLSELWTNKIQRQPQQTQKKGGEKKVEVKEEREEYYSLDIVSCEGVNNKLATNKQTVRKFAMNQKLGPRVEDWEWFMNLSVEVGKKRLE